MLYINGIHSSIIRKIDFRLLFMFLYLYQPNWYLSPQIAGFQILQHSYNFNNKKH